MHAYGLVISHVRFLLLFTSLAFPFNTQKVSDEHLSSLRLSARKRFIYNLNIREGTQNHENQKVFLTYKQVHMTCNYLTIVCKSISLNILHRSE